jgi:beta-barrel assembly-enhancing protease
VSAPHLKYEGFAYQTGAEHNATPGQIVFTSNHLDFEHADGVFELALEQLDPELGADGGAIFHDTATGWHIESADDRILKDHFLLRNPHLRDRVRDLHARREGGRSLKSALIFLAGFVLVFCIAWLLLKVATNSVANHAPVAWEEHLADKIIADYPKLFVVDTRDKRIGVVTQLVARIAATLPPEDRKFQFRVVILNRYINNAFALPGGRIYVFKSLLDRTREPEELAGVLAHEMAHVTQRHGLRKLISAGGPYYVLRLFISSDQGVLSAISAGSQLLVSQSYSRVAEREADTVGWQYLVAANIDPRGMADYLQSLTVDENENIIPKMFRSHPASDDRIAYLNQLWADSPHPTNFVTLPEIPYTDH